MKKFIPQETHRRLLTLRNAIWLSAMLLFAFKAEAQCPPGDVNLSSQAQVNQFLVDYPNCTQITGQLVITGNTTDLSPLNRLTHITRSLVISGTELTDINGLTGLVSVGTFIQIGGENAPANPQLQNISGLNNVTSVGGAIIIIKNPSLTGITGFNALAQVGGAFDVRQNANLTNIEGFVNLTTIGGYSYINDTKAVSIAGLSNLQSIGSFLILDNNANLISTSFLNNLTTVGGGLAIRNNAQLQNLNGLSRLTSVGGKVLRILNNTVLSDISALQNVNPATISEQGLMIENNPALSVCNLPNFCTYLANPAATHPRTISGNLANCADEAAVVAACPRPDCPPGDVRLRSQAEVNQFVADYPNCTEIAGLLRIGEADGSSSDITDISGLSNLRRIGGILFVQNNGVLQNLDGLDNLEHVGGRLYIGHNAQLREINALGKLTGSGGPIVVINNAAIRNLDGLIGIVTMNAFISIDGNAALDDISGIRNIDPNTITELYIQNNPALAVCDLDNVCSYLQSAKPRNISGNLANCVDEAAVVAACSTPDCPPGDVLLRSQAEVNQFVADYPNCTEIAGLLQIGEFQGSVSNVTDIRGLSKLTRIAGGLFVQYTGVLQNLDGLNSLASVGGDVYIGNNAQLLHVDGLNSLASVGGFTDINNNTALVNVDGLSSLTSIGKGLFIGYNAALANLDGLRNLSALGGYLRIRDNASLLHVNGLGKITQIGGNIYLTNNPVLNDISGMRNIAPGSIETEYGISILNNAALSVCNLPNLCTYLANPAATHPREISGNAGDCITEQAVTDACNASAGGCTNVTSTYEQWPPSTFNPACQGTEETITIEAETGEYSKVQVSAGRIYTFSSSVATDYVTIASEDASVVYAYGSTAVTWTATRDEVVRFFLHLDDQCNSSSEYRSRIVSCRVLPGDDCTDAYNISSLFGGPQHVSQTSGLYDNTGYTSINDPATGHECHTGDAGLRFTVWYNFTGDGNTYRIRAVRCSATNYNEDTQVAIYSGDCGALAPEACNDDEDVANGLFNFSIELSTVQGRSYRMLVDGYGTSQGEYCLEVTRLTSTGVTEISHTDIRVSPNPTTGTIRLDNVTADEVQVYDGTGRQVLQVVRPGSEIDLGQVPAGMYLLRISAGGQHYSARVVKQ